MRLSLWLVFGRLFRGRGLRWRSAFALIAGHTFLEAAHAFAKSAHQFWNLSAAKKDQHDHQNDQPVHWKFHNKCLLPLLTLTRPLHMARRANTHEITV